LAGGAESHASRGFALEKPNKTGWENDFLF